jgi:DNA-directed RNA polymerase specialized sigma24 family protein
MTRLAEFLRQEREALVGYVRRRIDDAADHEAEDIVQDVVVHLFDRADPSTPRTSPPISTGRSGTGSSITFGRGRRRSSFRRRLWTPDRIRQLRLRERKCWTMCSRP